MPRGRRTSQRSTIFSVSANIAAGNDDRKRFQNARQIGTAGIDVVIRTVLRQSNESNVRIHCKPAVRP
jgi:hypothetical protein